MRHNPEEPEGVGGADQAGEHGQALRRGLAAAPESVASLTQTNFAHNLRR